MALFAGTEKIRIKSNGNVGIGTTSPSEKLDVAGTVKMEVLKITGGSDLAEPFEVTGETTVQPGIVVSIDPAHPGRLTVSTAAYDRKVAGIVSGANGVNPGILMTANVIQPRFGAAPSGGLDWTRVCLGRCFSGTDPAR